MKILLTGGHFSPALAIIEKLKGEEIIVVGRKFSHEGDKGESFEYNMCMELGVPFRSVRAGRLQRVLTPQTIPSLLRFPVGIIDSLKLLRQEKPDVVVVFGGYIGLAVATAAKMLSIPVVLHEQVQGAGVTARIIDKFASVVCLSFETSRKYFKNKNIVMTGNPIRESLRSSRSPSFEVEGDTIYITGGSSGSHAINFAIQQILPDLLKEYTVVHQVGNNSTYKDLEVLSTFSDKLNTDLKKKYILKTFFDTPDIGWLMQHAKLIVSRAGANTVTELIAFGAVALLIPLPYGQKNEQLENAKLYKESGLGEYLLQESLTPQLLLDTIHAMIKKYAEYKKSADSSDLKTSLAAADLIVEQIYRYGRKKPNTGRETSENI